MPSRTKWIESIPSHEPVSGCAHFALRLRLRLVDAYLDEVARAREPSSDDIHQLRVATRRASATIDNFEDLLPPRRAKSLRKYLKRVRKAAGDARDFDVLAERLADTHDARHRYQALADRVEALGRQARVPVTDICATDQRKMFLRRSKRVLRRLAWTHDDAPEPVFAEFAVEKMRAVTERFFTAACDDLSDIERLHEFRICGKRLRYSMENFSAAFGPRFREELYPLLESLQDRLGAINDHAEAIKRFELWATEWRDPTLRAQLDEVLASERSALVESRAHFEAWWSPERAANWRRRFDEVLSNARIECVA